MKVGTLCGDEIEVTSLIEPEAEIFDITIELTDGRTGNDITTFLPWRDARVLADALLEETFEAEEAECQHFDIPLREVKVVSMEEVRRRKAEYLESAEVKA